MGTLTVNVAGSFLLGALLSGVQAGVLWAGAPQWLLTVAGTGFCGALTTFSTFGYETIRLVEDGSWLAAVANVAVSVVAGLVASGLGWWLVAALAR